MTELSIRSPRAMDVNICGSPMVRISTPIIWTMVATRKIQSSVS